MTRKRNMILAGVAVLAAAGLGTGVAVAADGSSGQPAAAASPAASGVAAYSAPGYSWYRSMGPARPAGCSAAPCPHR
jgi:hypothetical protein